jgi:hypothetical protein
MNLPLRRPKLFNPQGRKKMELGPAMFGEPVSPRLACQGESPPGSITLQLKIISSGDTITGAIT